LRRVLFVDDDQYILDGLQNLLRKQRSRWDMCFALGGAAALELFAAAPFDVIVSDMRMPGMDGAELLAHVRERYPAARRIVLSGYAEPAAVQRALEVAHQFLSKPCRAPDLIDAIDAGG
jgi:YesN/AraC family two-component response regulator